MHSYFCSVSHSRDLQTGAFLVERNLEDRGIWITVVRGKRGGSGDEAPDKLPQKNVFFEHRDLPYIDAVNSIFICSELHVF